MAMGARIKLSLVDCTTELGARELITESMTSLNCPIGSIFNFAVHYKDVMFDDQTVEQFKAVVLPKAHATFYLDKVSRELCPQLDYFLVFSSASCGRGNPGQSSYNYANCVMEEICRKRIKDGLTGLAVQWGIVGDVGVVAEGSQGVDVILLGKLTISKSRSSILI